LRVSEERKKFLTLIREMTVKAFAFFSDAKQNDRGKKTGMLRAF
jgi:hypothetical protein